MVTQRL